MQSSTLAGMGLASLDDRIPLRWSHLSLYSHGDRRFLSGISIVECFSMLKKLEVFLKPVSSTPGGFQEDQSQSTGHWTRMILISCINGLCPGDLDVISGFVVSNQRATK